VVAVTTGQAGDRDLKIVKSQNKQRMITQSLQSRDTSRVRRRTRRIMIGTAASQCAHSTDRFLAMIDDI
jgi:hypothetical protein